MDRNQYAIVWEGLKNLLGAYFLYSQGDWFGGSASFPGIIYFLSVYFIISTFVTAWFVFKHRKEDAVPAAVAV
jgi:hypothetical protein